MKEEKGKGKNLEEQLFLKENGEQKATRTRAIKNKRNKNDQGITLIALVITIIIMLILAGITLSTALGDNGLIERAKRASEGYRKAAEKESNGIEKLIDEMGKNKRRKWGNQTISRPNTNSRANSDPRTITYA